MMQLETILRDAGTYISCGADLIEKLQPENIELRVRAGMEPVHHHDTFTQRQMLEQYKMIQAVIVGMQFSK